MPKIKKITKCIKCDKKVCCSNLCKMHFQYYFERKVKKTIKKFSLFKPDDKIGVAVSGGKDSTVCLYLLNKFKYNIIGVTVDAKIGNYTKQNLDNLRSVCKENKIKLHEISFREEFGHSLCYLRSLLKSKGHNYSSCMLCGVLRRFLINKYSKKLKLDVIVTGHNLDDEAQAFLMNVYRNDTKLAIRQGPISGNAKIKQFVKRVKPLYLCSEKETTAYSKLMKFPVNYEACPCSTGAYRRKYREHLDKFEKDHPDVKYNIVNFFLNMIHPMKSKIKQGKIATCKKCGEPCANETCRTCEIFGCIEKAKVKKKGK